MSDSTTAHKLQLSNTALVCLTGTLLLAFAASLGMAFNVDAIALSFEVANARAGLVASTEMATIAVGTLWFARLSGSLNPHRVYLVGVVAILSCNLASILVPDTLWLTLVRAPAGFALGAVVATVMSTAGRSHRPEHTFGVINAAVGLMGIVVAYVLPRALTLGTQVPATWQLSPADGLYAVYVLAGLLALLFIRNTPKPEPHHTTASVAQGGHGRGWTALIGLGLLFFGHALLAVYLVRIGRQAGLEAQAIGYVLMAGGLVGVIAPLLAGYLGARFSSFWIVLGLSVLMTSLVPALAGAKTAFAFASTAPFFAALPIAIMPVFLGAVSTTEPTGRLTGAHPAFVMIGSAVAPLAGGLLSDLGGFTVSGLVAIACFAAAFALMQPVLRQSDRIRAGYGEPLIESGG